MEKEHVLAKDITKLNYLQSEIFCPLVHMTVRYPGNLLWCLFSTGYNGISLQRLLEGSGVGTLHTVSQLTLRLSPVVSIETFSETIIGALFILFSAADLKFTYGSLTVETCYLQCASIISL